MPAKLTQPLSRPFAVLLVTALAAALPLSLHAKTFKFARAADMSTWDVHAQNVGVNNTMHAAVYDTLIEYDSQTFKPRASLASEWKQVSPTQLRLTIRPGVKFSDGSDFSAVDAKFSLERAKAKTSNFTVYALGVDRVEVVNASTLDIFSTLPNPVLLNQLTELRMLSKAWAEKNNSAEPKDIRTKDETFAHRNAMGTGPFMLKNWTPDQRD
jgi:peptide/nickel transport system substrate-binding protein